MSGAKRFSQRGKETELGCLPICVSEFHLQDIAMCNLPRVFVG